jgi:carbon-monoxide dehydrogenase medium subunit
MFPASFAYVAPRSVQEALELLTQHGEQAKLLAGGHSLIPAMKLRLVTPRTLIDLCQIPGLSGLRVEGNTLLIGALTVHTDLASADLVRRHFAGLAEAASVIGDLQVRNRGTIGGSVAHADPAADLPVILTALDASFILQSASGSRTVAAGDFFLDYYTTALKPYEVLTEIRLPLPPRGAASAYAKLPHPASGYVVVSAGVYIECGSSGSCVAARVVLGGLGNRPIRALATEAALKGQFLTAPLIATAAAAAADATDPDGDTYASAEYKRHVASVYAKRAIERAVQRATK